MILKSGLFYNQKNNTNIEMEFLRPWVHGPPDPEINRSKLVRDFPNSVGPDQYLTRSQTQDRSQIPTRSKTRPDPRIFLVLVPEFTWSLSGRWSSIFVGPRSVQSEIIKLLRNNFFFCNFVIISIKLENPKFSCSSVSDRSPGIDLWKSTFSVRWTLSRNVFEWIIHRWFNKNRS